MKKKTVKIAELINMIYHIVYVLKYSPSTNGCSKKKKTLVKNLITIFPYYILLSLKKKKQISILYSLLVFHTKFNITNDLKEYKNAFRK